MNLPALMSKTRIALAASAVLLAIFGFTTRNTGADQSSTAIGDKAPELAFYNPDSTKVLKLSSLRGQYVLVDFWASWCGPCRRENPNVVKVYDKYKDKGFTIYSVSLDRAKEPWVAAIEKDNLKWENHVSDLKWWNSDAAALYGVHSIPNTFLVGRDGKIAAIGLRGAEQIEAALQTAL